MNLALPTLAGVRKAAKAIRPDVPETPLVRSEILSRALDAEVWLKNETVNPVASFKLRGALNAVLQAGSDGVVTSSTGNHGQGVAYAARLAGVGADIFLPERPNPVKKGMIAAFGATIHEVGYDLDDAKDRAKSFCAEHGHAFIDDGENLAVMEGAGTIGLEAAQALADIDAMIIPMGSGNLASGCAAALKGVQPKARVYAVQSSAAPAMAESFHAKQPVERPVATLADGLVCRVPAGLALAAMAALVDDAWLVSDEELLAGVRTLLECAHALVEPAGAAALAGAWAHREEFAGRRIVLLLTGANITAELMREAMALTPFFSLDGVI